MNIFYFYECPNACAEAQPDKMLVKMPLETAQMLCTAHRVLDGDEYADAVGLYKTAYKNHPCTIWARETSANYAWLYEHFRALCWEYTHRYGKTHASETKLMDALSKVPDNIRQDKLTPLAQAMPDKYKSDNPIASYRKYVVYEKGYAQWNKSRPKPIWWNKEWVA